MKHLLSIIVTILFIPIAIFMCICLGIMLIPELLGECYKEVLKWLKN